MSTRGWCLLSSSTRTTTTTKLCHAKCTCYIKKYLKKEEQSADFLKSFFFCFLFHFSNRTEWALELGKHYTAEKRRFARTRAANLCSRRSAWSGVCSYLPCLAPGLSLRTLFSSPQAAGWGWDPRCRPPGDTPAAQTGPRCGFRNETTSPHTHPHPPNTYTLLTSMTSTKSYDLHPPATSSGHPGWRSAGFRRCGTEVQPPCRGSDYRERGRNRSGISRTPDGAETHTVQISTHPGCFYLPRSVWN